MRAERFSDFLFRHRFVLFTVWFLHVYLWHYFVLGYMSWDGFSYRVGPVIELVQHGALGKDKYPYDWTLRGYVPFVELAHVPFLYAFGLLGLMIGFPLIVFPLCVWAVFLLVRELTGEARAGLFGAFAYAAMPMMNEQPFSGYVDFAVAGILAFWIYAVVRLRADERRWWTFVRLVIATVLLTMARSQGVYIAIVLLPLLLYALFATRRGLRIAIANKPRIALAIGALLVGSIPTIILQVYRQIVYGSPIAPSEFKLLGVLISPGAPLRNYLIDAGLGGDDVGSMARGFFEGFVWHAQWPIGAFYASRFMATGLICILALILLPVFVRASSRLERWLAVGCVLVSLLAHDFAVPRWAYSLMVVLIVIVGRSMAALAGSRSRWGKLVFWFGCVVLISHLFRPEVDRLQLKRRRDVSSRMNVADSKWFMHGPLELRPYPDGNYKFVIVGETGFVAQIFGLKLTNEVLETVPGTEVDPGCKRLSKYLWATPDVLFIDKQDFTKSCQRECAVRWPDACGAYRIKPAG